jgi:nucleotide-binding universal stress UspA family protein
MRALNIRSILVATDLQPSSDVALSGAAALAGALGAELHLLHSIELPTLGYPVRDTAVDLHLPVQDAQRLLEEQIARAVPPEQTVESRCVRIEKASRAINERAREVHADIVVLGPHRPRPFRGTILGNTADRVLRSAEVPILILTGPLKLPLRDITIPMDLSDPARGALDQGLVWAYGLGRHDDTGRSQANVRVLHVIPKAFEAYDFPFDRAVIVPQLNQEIEEAMVRVGGTGSLEVREEVVWGNAPAEEIVRHAQNVATDILVMGTHGYGALGRALIGSIASMVVRTAPCAVLLVPPKLWACEENEGVIPIEAEWSEPTCAPA